MIENIQLVREEIHGLNSQKEDQNLVIYIIIVAHNVLSFISNVQPSIVNKNE